MKKNKFINKINGFTLIELLVVIAMIGVLSAVVIASVSPAKEKAKEAAIISNLKNLSTAAEIYYLENNAYPSVNCVVPATVPVYGKFLTEIIALGADIHCNAGTVALNYAVSVKFKDKNYSVDKDGVVVWDSIDGPTLLNWTNAQNQCLNGGGKLPSRDQSQSLGRIYFSKYPSSSDFEYAYYWTSQNFNTTSSYTVRILSNSSSVTSNSTSMYYRCVRSVK